MRSEDHLRIVILGALDRWWHLEGRRLAEHDRVWEYTPDRVSVCAIVIQPEVVGVVLVRNCLARDRDFREIVFLQ